ncbi:hypothetical protein BKA62DRAFT_671658 [Auriculariales sp. MPI-PUGE-AT-0066]|nr:hypothetical protein BKA62DRAFT_671658 [Auriculariales sp. MPI-PUGE-AT-0066]
MAEVVAVLCATPWHRKYEVFGTETCKRYIQAQCAHEPPTYSGAESSRSEKGDRSRNTLRMFLLDYFAYDWNRASWEKHVIWLTVLKLQFSPKAGSGYVQLLIHYRYISRAPVAKFTDCDGCPKQQARHNGDSKENRNVLKRSGTASMAGIDPSTGLAATWRLSNSASAIRRRCSDGRSSRARHGGGSEECGESKSKGLELHIEREGIRRGCVVQDRAADLAGPRPRAAAAGAITWGDYSVHAI